MALRRDNQHAGLGHAPAGERPKPRAHRRRQIGRIGDIEAQLNRRLHLLDVLTAGAGRAHEIFMQLAFVDGDGRGDLNHDIVRDFSREDCNTNGPREAARIMKAPRGPHLKTPPRRLFPLAASLLPMKTCRSSGREGDGLDLRIDAHPRLKPEQIPRPPGDAGEQAGAVSLEAEPQNGGDFMLARGRAR